MIDNLEVLIGPNGGDSVAGGGMMANSPHLDMNVS